MKSNKILIFLFWMLLFGLLVNHAKADDILGKVFTEKELVTIDKIIQFYDQFVLSETNHLMPIEKAYVEFFGSAKLIIKNSEDLHLLAPSRNERINFYKTLDECSLSEIFTVDDTLKVRFRGSKEEHSLYSPYSFTLNLSGKYVIFLKELSTTNHFFKAYYESIEICGDICPTNYSLILSDYKEVDFSKKEQRLVIIISFLRLQETIRNNE